jgi:hypothetical protein
VWEPEQSFDKTCEFPKKFFTLFLQQAIQETFKFFCEFFKKCNSSKSKASISIFC